MMGILHLFCFCIGFAKAMENSPALLWSPERSMVNLPDVSSVDSFTPSDFYDQYLSPLMQSGKDNAVVFLQDKLSVDDFTNYADVYSVDSNGGAFKNVKRLMEDHYSLEVPHVDSPHIAVEKLKKNFNGNIHMVDGLNQLESLKLGDGKSFLLIVSLHPVIDSVDEERAITKNDALVGDVTKLLQERGIKYTALFTGKSSQQSEIKSDSSDPAQHSNRHLLATNLEASSNDKCKFMNVSSGSGSVYVFLCGFRVCIKDEADQTKCAVELNATITDDIASTSKYSNKTGEVILKFDKLNDVTGKGAYKSVVTFEVSLQQDRWTMDRISLELTETSGGAGNSTDIKNATLINYELDKVVPRLYSFHCSRMRLYVETVKDKSYKKYKGTSITLEGFQFQVFDIFHDRFFHAQDCVGFFTAGIWMGIVPGLLLIFILMYGTSMLLNLSVMDKFDDPKGKTIINNVSD